jgi:hypothetical protein
MASSAAREMALPRPHPARQQEEMRAGFRLDAAFERAAREVWAQEVAPALA